MSANLIWKFLVVLVCVVIVGLFFSIRTKKQLSPKEHIDKIRELRNQKDDMMRNSKNSPLPPTARDVFKGLTYFEPDPNFKYQATLEIVKDTQGLSLAGLTVAGILVFQSADSPNPIRLTAFWQTKENKALFVPFQDKTNNQTTYGGGRYLDAEIESDGDVWLDFNTCYNPYCAYNERYICPIPPFENKMNLTITAGEKRYKNH